MSPSRRYDALDERVARLILRLHKRHPNLGHNGLLNALKDEGVTVNPRDLERFMTHANIEGESWSWKRNNIRGFLKIVGLTHDDPLNEGDEYVN